MNPGMTAFESGPGSVEVQFLADTSALARIAHHPAVRSALSQPLELGLIAYCDVTRLEMGITARSGDEHQALGRVLASLPVAPLTAEDYDRAFEVQGMLAGSGHHRGIAIPDLLVAACAERLGLTVIHCDADFDLIAQVTGQSAQWPVDRSLL